ncbi:MAG: CBS domain-containing protein [Deltaproteobacteria bacterium]|jgi:CBS domain-containing protein
MATKKNNEVMHKEFASIGAESGLKAAFEAIRQNLEGPPHSPGLVVLDKQGKCAGVLTMDDLMTELGMLYHDACDKPGQKDWADKFFNQCEIAGLRKISNIMSGKGLTVKGGDDFDRACEVILDRNLNLVPVVDESSKVVGIITRRMVLEELGPRMFK